MTTTRDMSDAHEAFLADLLDGSVNPGSGNQWRNPIDGRQNRKTLEFAFAWDGKSTYGKSISIPLSMWEKARMQAGGDRPMLALRWYANEKLEVRRDLVVISAHDAAEMQERANEAAALRKTLASMQSRLIECMEQDASKVRYSGEAAALCTEIDEALGIESTNAGDD